MTVRIILVPLAGGEADRTALDTALVVAKQAGAHLQALHVRPDSRNALPLLGEGMSGAMIEEMIDIAEKEGAERATLAKATYDAFAASCGLANRDEPGGDGPSIGWRQVEGREDELVARLGRLADLIVTSQPEADVEAPTDLTLNAVLFETGRPVLVAPAKAPAKVAERVAIAWNGSAEAARAVAAGMDILKGASAVVVLSAEAERVGAGDTADELAAYLAWHGIKATAQSFSPAGHSVGEALLMECGKVGADLMVMGAYTHSRMWQVILGGVTKHVLGSAEIPVLMAH